MFRFRNMKLHINILALAVLCFSSFSEASAQKKEFFGYVYSVAENTPMQGIKVSTKYLLGKSATTDNAGKFKISLKETAVANTVMLTFSYPGYETKEQYCQIGDTAHVYMTRIGDEAIDKSVYYPYSNQKSNNFTGAVEPVDFEYSAQVISTSFEELLESSTVQVIGSSGMPGEGKVINIRGYSTIFADEKPLVVIDGQVLGNYRFDETTSGGFYQDPLINIDPRNIEALTILKDVSSTAIYGAKASNGVILIKTKEAKVGKTEFDITGFSGINYMNKRLPVISNSEYFKPYLLEQMYGNENGAIIDDYFIEDESFPDFYRYNNQTDWQEEIFDYGKRAGANFNVRGGDAIAKYYFAGGYVHDEGSVKNTEFNKFNFRLNADVDMIEWLTAQANLGVTISNGSLKEQGMSYANPVLVSLFKAPFLYPFLIDSNNVALPLTEDADLLGISNPYEVINNSELSLSSFNFMGTLNFKFKISKHLEANLRGSSELNKMNEFVFIPNHGFHNNEYPTLNQVKKGTGSFSRNSSEINVRYNRNIKELHNFNGILGSRMNFDEVIQDIASGVGTPSDEFKDLETTLDDGRAKSGYQYFRNEITNFLNLSYNYREEYYIDFTMTGDMSSTLGKVAEPQMFGLPVANSTAIGLGWNLSRLAGLRYSSIVNYAKIRVSAGKIGNVVYNPYISQSYYSPIQYYTATGYIKNSFSNEDLNWETTNKLNFGTDIVLLHHKLFVNADVYYHSTVGLLNNSNSNNYTGNQNWNNNGDLNTLGTELRVKFKAIERSAFYWNTELVFTKYKTTVANLNDPLIYDFGEIGTGQKIFENNEAAGSFYGYEVIGVIASDEDANSLNLVHSNGSKFKAGDIQFRDLDGNHIIDDADKVVIGNAAPDFYGSWVNKISYKQVSLLADISFVVGNDIYNHTRKKLESMSGFENQSTATLRRWQVNGQQTDVPTSAWGDPLGNSRFSDRWIEDGSYIRLKRITLSLNLNKWLKSSNNSELYITGVNLITLDNYLGYDPEFAYGTNILWQGIDYGKFPQNRSVMVGVKFGL